jgi:hypothetical protein
MKRSTIRFTALVAMTVIASGVSAVSLAKERSQDESISVSFGPCNGYCPVYDLKTSSDGSVSFHGERHTAVLGNRTSRKSLSVYLRTARLLASFRPTEGSTVETQCTDRLTDHPHYRIVWKDANGQETVLQHDRGCLSLENAKLNTAIDQLPNLLGVSRFAKGTQRAGTSRG